MSERMPGTAHAKSDPRGEVAGQTEGAGGELRLLVAAAVNNEAILRQNLLQSPLLSSGGGAAGPGAAGHGAALAVRMGMKSASEAYNAILDGAGMESERVSLVAFVHQDVLLPAGWDGRLAAAARELEMIDPAWAVLGIVGATAGGEVIGRCWSNGLQRVAGRAVARPTAAQSLDEVVIVLRRDAGLRFDERLPGFHLYGTDIAQTALEAGRGVYIFDGPVVHNSVPVVRLGPGYTAAYRYMQRKWRARLPIVTPVMRVTRWGLPLWHHRLAATKNILLGRAARGTRHDQPALLAEKLGT